MYCRFVPIRRNFLCFKNITVNLDIFDKITKSSFVYTLIAETALSYIIISGIKGIGYTKINLRILVRTLSLIAFAAMTNT